MSNVTTSTSMSLPIPIVGSESGPSFAIDINSCLTIIDSHTHASGSGVPITPAAININADLPLSSNNLTQARTLRMTSQSAVLSVATDLGCLYNVLGDLYYNDGSGNQIRFTQSGSIAGASGTITGLVSPASASYVAGSTKFVFQSAANTSAYIDCSSVLIRNLTASSKALTLAAPNAMGADYTLVLPALPASQKIMTLDASGNITAPYTVDGSTITIASNVIGVPNNGITGAKLNSNVVDNSTLQYSSSQLSIKASGVGTTQIAAGAVTQAKLAAKTVATSSLINVSVPNSQGGLLITNGVVSLTSTGRPAMIWINTGSNSSAAPGGIVLDNGGSGIVGSLELRRNGSSLGFTSVVGQGFFAIDAAPSAGTNSYQLYGWTDASTSFSLPNCLLQAVEL